MPKLFFLEAANGKPLAKTYTNEGPISYPLVKRVSSHDFEYEDLDQFRDLLLKAAARGWCLLKGSLEEPLVEESRKGKVSRDTPTDYLVIDIDGLSYELPDKDQLDTNDIRKMAVDCLKLLPEVFSETSHIFQASSSLGVKPGKFSGHFFFQLDREYLPVELKSLLTQMNFLSDEIKNQLSLSASGTALSYIIDPTIADNSRLIYLSPPRFLGDKFTNPIPNNDDRIVINKRLEDKLCLDEFALSMAGVQDQAKTHVTEVRKSLGLRTRRTKVKEYEDPSGERTLVVQNPDPCNMSYVSDEGRYVRYNINGGDSGAYWVFKYNPTIVYNFKGEPNFLFKAADPDTYAWHCEHFGGLQEAQPQEFNGSLPIAFQEFSTSRYYYGYYHEKEENVELYTAKTERQVENFLAQHQVAMPANLPIWRYAFEPNNSAVFDSADQFINKYQPPDWIRYPVDIPAYAQNNKMGLAYDNLRQLTPIIWALADSICGNGRNEFEYFINWLAQIVQLRGKARTAWVFHGVPGTGKGLFFHRVLSPLIGDKYCQMKTGQDLEEKFNSWLSQCLLFAVDEFRMNARNSVMLNKIKNMITEPRGTIRAMHNDQVETDLYANVIFFTNDRDAVHIQEGDRRFNIAPRQEHPLTETHPDLLDNNLLTSKLPEEIARLAAYLISYEVNIQATIVPMENEAKRAMRIAGEDTIDSFVRALAEGDFEYFVPVFDEPMPVHGTDWATPSKLVLKTILREYKPDHEWIMTVSEMMPLFNVLCGKSENRIKFGKMLHHHGLDTERRRKKGKTPEMSITVVWHINEVDLERLRKEHLSDEYSQLHIGKRTQDPREIEEIDQP